MNKVFISHSSKQKELVERLVSELGRDNCFVDEYDFRPAEKIESEITQKIDCTKIFCLLISNDSLNSDWVRFEENYVKSLVERDQALFLGFIIDPSIRVTEDNRIALWEKNYILNIIPTAKIIARVLASKLRELDIKTYPYLKYRNSLFFGRGNELSELEYAHVLKYTESCKAVSISGLPHVGRKRFAMEFLRKISGDPQKDFCSVSLEKDQSVEDMIFYLNDYVEVVDRKELTRKLANEDLNKKCSLAVSLLNKLYSYKQDILIVDDNCLIRRDGTLSEWFVRILKDRSLERHTGIFIVSPIRINPRQIDLLPMVQAVLNPLKPKEMSVLFQAYSDKRNLRLPKADIDSFSSEIGGFPCYVYPIVDEWAQYGKVAASRKLEEIKCSTEDVLAHILDLLNESGNGNSIQLLILLSRFDVVSIKQLEKLLPDMDLNSLLDQFQELSILELFGYAREYVRIHPAVADYINRSKTLKLDKTLIGKISANAESLIFSGDTQDVNDDLPTYLYGIKQTLRHGLSTEKDISNYMIPSLALSVIIEEYENQKYSNVDILCQRMLERRKNYDYHILRSVHYWQCLAYCRTGNPKINTAVSFFGESHTSHFLLGFYYRIDGNIRKAEVEYEKSIRLAGENTDSSKVKHELVLVKILQNDYEGALALAEENYNRQTHNYFYIEAYFRCYVKDEYADSVILLRLIGEMERSQDNNRTTIAQTMRAEYSFYRQGDFWGAARQLEDLIRACPAVKYPQDALKEICQRNHKESYYRQFLQDCRKDGVQI